MTGLEMGRIGRAAAAAAVAVAVSASSAFAQILTSGSATASTANPAPAGTTFAPGPGGLVGGIDGGAINFVAPGAGTLSIRVTDCCRPGDVFEVILDGVSVGRTSDANIDEGPPSEGIFLVPTVGGAQALDIWDIVLSYIGAPSPFDSDGTVVPADFTPAGLEYEVSFRASAIPEPSTYALLATGLGVIVGVARRRRHG